VRGRVDCAATGRAMSSACFSVLIMISGHGLPRLVVIIAALLGAPERASAQDTSCNHTMLQATIRVADDYLSKNPDALEALVNRDIMHFKLGNYGPALQDFERAARLDSGNPGVVLLGLVYVALGQMDRAFSEYNAVLKQDPQNATALYARSLAHRKNGDNASADADRAEAVRIDPEVVADFARLCVR
jgi:tetratricopeptide (TPR) repeat protein